VSQSRIDRREFISMGAATLGTLTSQASGAAPRELGTGRRAYGDRSSFESSVRTFSPSPTPGTGSSRTPLQDLCGIITPSSLHFERHHAEVPAIAPQSHRLLIHGLVDRPLIFTMDELRRLPAVSRVHFIECSGNSSREQEGRPGTTPQQSSGFAWSHCARDGAIPLDEILAHLQALVEATTVPSMRTLKVACRSSYSWADRVRLAKRSTARAAYTLLVGRAQCFVVGRPDIAHPSVSPPGTKPYGSGTSASAAGSTVKPCCPECISCANEWKCGIPAPPK
jgi:DMSO/TMAO reductase YedYZ molybdopterin-dependent catalytic subunit